MRDSHRFSDRSLARAAQPADIAWVRILCLTTVLGWFVSAACLAAGNSAFDPVTGYRIAHYRAAVPETVPGGTRVTLEEVDALLARGAVLVDVMPAEGAGPDPRTGTWRLAHAHNSIPGATWLPDVGRGVISQEMDDYFARNLEQLTAGNKQRPMILFCQSDCWMAWNAVQRAAKLGYTQIYWFAEGTDGWVEWGDRKLVKVEPRPLDRQ